MRFAGYVLPIFNISQAPYTGPVKRPIVPQHPPRYLLCRLILRSRVTTRLITILITIFTEAESDMLKFEIFRLALNAYWGIIAFQNYSNYQN